MKKPEALRWIQSKGKNKRIDIVLWEKEDGEKFFSIHTRTLISFKDRHISKTDTSYSVETFSLINELSNKFLEDQTIVNKILLRELNKINKFNAKGNF